MIEALSAVVSLLEVCRDDEALHALDDAIVTAAPADAALAHMLKYALYAGDLKDWKRADAALKAAVELEPEYARYNAEAEGIESRQPVVYPKCRELALLVSQIYRARYRNYRSQG